MAEAVISRTRKERRKKRKGKRKAAAGSIDRHLLYSAAVQSVEADLDFFERVFKKRHGRRLRTLKEDFCGTAMLACEWVQRRDGNEAWGVDLDGPTLEFGRDRYATRLGDAAERLHLIEGDVLDVSEPAVELVSASNFSYSIFKSREQLSRYFRAARASLAPGGLFIIDVLGGQESCGELTEKRRIPSSRSWDGEKIPGFTYIWEQKRFNPIDHALLCKIHFKLKNGTRIRNAFTYDWRMWTLPELRELLADAGFADSEVYTEGWDDEADDTDGIFRKRKYFENQEGWVAYVVAYS